MHIYQTPIYITTVYIFLFISNIYSIDDDQLYNDNIIEVTNPDGILKGPLLNSNINQTFKWIIKAQKGYSISVL
jgi:hypothetical protein